MADLIVEDGSGIQNADTLISTEDFASFCDKRGVSIDSTKAGALLVKAMDLLTTYEPDFQGSRTVATQALPFPRKGMILDASQPDVVWPENEIPKCVIWAQCFAAIAAFEGVDLLPVQQNGKVLVRKKTAVIEKEWAFDPNSDTIPTIPLVDSSLAPVLKDNGASGYIEVFRA